MVMVYEHKEQGLGDLITKWVGIARNINKGEIHGNPDFCKQMFLQGLDGLLSSDTPATEKISDEQIRVFRDYAEIMDWQNEQTLKTICEAYTQLMAGQIF